MTSAAYARRRGRSPQYIRKLVRRSMIREAVYVTPRGHYLIDPVAADRLIRDRIGRFIRNNPSGF